MEKSSTKYRSENLMQMCQEQAHTRKKEKKQWEKTGERERNTEAATKTGRQNNNNKI